MPANPAIYYEGPADELFSGRTGSPFNMDGHRDYTRRFRVRTKDKRLSTIAVCSCPGLPLPFSPYQSGNGLEYDLAALMTGMTAAEENDDDWASWVITATYSTRMPEGGQPTGDGAYGDPGSAQGGQNNPELEPPEFGWDFETLQKALSKDLDKKAYLNSANQPLTPAPLFDIAYPVLTMSRNELAFDDKTATKYAYAINSDVFLGYKPEQAQCLPPSAKRVYRGNIQYWRVNYRIRFSVTLPDGSLLSWQPEFLDQGLMQTQNNPAAANVGQPVPIIKYGHPITQPVMLDGSGRELLPIALVFGIAVMPPPVYLTFRNYRKTAFADLFNRGFNP
jgi:hypothetical protein